jgi:ornithine lipid ester-linked acyl 2-hydroxylase
MITTCPKTSGRIGNRLFDIAIDPIHVCKNVTVEFMYYDSAQFPYLHTITAKREHILAEYLRVAEARLKPMIDTHITTRGWNGFPLMSSAYRFKANWQKCPVTTELISGIDGLYAAGFYVLEPHTELPAHKNFPMDIYRMHLGLIVPENCAFRVGPETRSWSAHDWLVFCPDVEHEGYNRSDSRRVILLIDVWKNPRRRPLRDRILTWLGGVKIMLSRSRLGQPFLQFVNTNLFARRIVNRLTGRR